MQKQASSKIVSLVFAVLVVGFLAVFYVFAWTEPSVAPPGGNVPAPINAGDIEQMKSGALRIGGVFRTDTATHLAATNGNVGIGTTGPSTRLHVVGGARITGLVNCNTIDTDASGNLSCGTDEGGAGGDNLGNHIATQNIRLNGNWLSGDGGNEGVFVNNAGNVGIGTTSPGTKLEIAGQVKITGGTPGAGKVLTSDASGLASWQAAGGVKTYDSGWFPVAMNITYTKAHSLGELPFMVQLWFSENSDGSGNVIIRSSTDSDYAPHVWAYVTISVVDINSSDIKIRSGGSPYLAVFPGKSLSSGYARIKAISF